MKPMKLKDGLYWNGVLDPDLRVFDIIMPVSYTHLRAGQRRPLR